MSKFGCSCGHTIVDQTDFLPYKSYIREDEDVQKPIELLADLLSQYWDARQQGQGDEFIRHCEAPRFGPESAAEIAQSLADKPLAKILAHLIDPFWNNYDRVLYECEDCGRLWVEMDDNRLVSYLPETDTRHVLWSRHNHNPYGYLDE